MSDELRPLWDFGDLDASESRFTERLRAEEDDGMRAELLTQLARVAGLRGDFDQGEERLCEAEALASSSPRAGIRIDLERGRLLNSSGSPEAALPLFVRATEAAEEQEELFIAADSAHMAAIAASTREERLAWTRRGIEISESGDGGRYWVGPLLNNLGWDQFEAGEHEAALASFEQALAHRLQDPENREAIAFGRYGVAKAQQALGRHNGGGGAARARDRLDAGRRRARRLVSRGPRGEHSGTRPWRRGAAKRGARSLAPARRGPVVRRRR